MTMNPDLNLTIFPATTYLSVKPGTSITHRVLLKYEGTTRINVLPELVDFKTDGLTGTPILQKPSQLSYVTLQNPGKDLGKIFVIEPGSQVELVIKVDPPLHAKLGEQPLSLVLTANPDTTVVFDGSSTQTAAAIASNIILSVQNDFENQGQLEIEKIQLPRVVDSFSTIKFSTLVKNTGQNAVAAAGEMRINHGWSGKELKHWYIYPDLVLADNTRQLRTTFQKPEDLDSDVEIVFEDSTYKPPFLIGPYEVRVELTESGQPNHNIQKQAATIWAFPFSIIGLILLGIALYIIINKLKLKQEN